MLFIDANQSIHHPRENRFHVPLNNAYETVERMTQVQAEMVEWSYKPGWCFLATPYAFHIRATVADTYHPDVLVTVGVTTPLCCVPRDHEEFAAWLEYEIQAAEIHESREWLKYQGRVFNDPHK
jgi:hypothetical protein